MAEELGELPYTGTVQPQLGATDYQGRKLLPYIPTPDLVEAVNLSIFLRRPLLLRGEPGCGKSLLANAVAFELGIPLEIWGIRSTTRAVDGLYVYDAIARLRDAQLAATEPRPVGAKIRKDKSDSDVQDYIRFGPVGRAFAKESHCVLLIDEIDKADIDFPNDILDIIERPRFMVEEAGVEVQAKHPPIIIITSNDEKELPDAFLRRCVFAYVPFPTPPRLREILAAHFDSPPDELLDRVVQRFTELRNRQDQDAYGGVKKVSTSELIDWMRVVLRSPGNAMSALADGRPYPYRPVLIKRKEDLEFAEKPMDKEPAVTPPPATG